MPKAPQILEGARGPRQAREQWLKANPGTEIEAPAGEGTCYFSKYEKLRIQYTSPVEQVDREGRKYRDKPIACQFDGHFFRNDHKDLKVRAKIDEALQSDPTFGINKVFWLNEDRVAYDRNKYVAQAMAQIKQDPLILAEIEKQVAARLKIGESQDLPTPKAD
jgi:hypothetical protein